VLVHVGFASQGKSYPKHVFVAVHELIQVPLAEGIEEPGPLKHVCKAKNVPLAAPPAALRPALLVVTPFHCQQKLCAASCSCKTCRSSLGKTRTATACAI